tara:strand:- start:2403 stop:2567 length:165 start_codon:yes stop_codon:yes gene_type:complete
MYKVKDKYKECSIQPGAKPVRLAFLNQAQIAIMIKAGYDKYFVEVKKKVSKKDD